MYMQVYVYMHIYIYIGLRIHTDLPTAVHSLLQFGLYTILPSPYYVGCKAYKEGVAGRAYIAQWSCNSIAIR